MRESNCVTYVVRLYPVSYIPSVEGYIGELEDALGKYIGIYDLIVPKPEDVQQYEHRSIYHHYSLYPIHYNDGLKLAGEVTSKLFPELAADFESYFNQSKAYFTTMFITSRESFFAYCKILFDVIFALIKRIDTENASIMNRRAAAFIGEYLTGAYFFHIKKNKKVLEVSRYLFINTDPAIPIDRVFPEKSVSIIFSCDDKYAPTLCVCLISLLQNASPLHNYDILIIDDRIGINHKKQISALERKNVSIRYIKINPYIAGIDRSIFYLCSSHTISTYYRFFVPIILSAYSKVLYMDPDTIVKGNIAELYKEEIADYWIGAAVDIGMVCNTNDRAQKTKEIIQNTLFIDDPYKYFQTGVMLMNLEKLREEKFTERCIECLKRVKTPRFVDQDIINSVCYKHVKFIDGKWNVIWHLPFLIKFYERLLPQATYLKYLDDRKNPSIIHFAGPKPWNVLNQEFSDVFWSYCRKTPCYEEFLDRMWRSGIPQSTRGLENKVNVLGERINQLTNESLQIPAPSLPEKAEPKPRGMKKLLEKILGIAIVAKFHKKHKRENPKKENKEVHNAQKS